MVMVASIRPILIQSRTCVSKGCTWMYGNVELLAMIFIDCKMVLVSGHVVSNDTNVSILHLPCNVGMQHRHTTF